MDNNEDFELDVFRLCRFVLSKWLVISLSAVVFAMLAVSYKYFSFKNSSVPLAELDKQFEIEVFEEQLDGRKQKVKKKVNYNIYKADYEAQMADYIAKYSNYVIEKKIRADEVKQAKISLDLQNEYLRTSKLYNTKDESFYENVLFYSVRDLNSNSNSNSNSNVQHPAVTMAVGLLTSQSFIAKISNKLNMSNLTNDKMVQELIQVRVRDLYSFEIVIRGDTQELVDAVLGEIEFLNKELKGFCGSFCEFSKVNLSSGKGNPLVLKQLKSAEHNLVYKLEQQFEDAKKNEKSVIEPIKFEGFGKLQTLEKFKISKYIKFILIGFILGSALSICAYALKYIMDGKLKDQNYITDVFGINKISCIHDFDKRTNESAVKALSENLKYIIAKGNNSIIMLSTMMGTYEQQLSEIKTIIDNFNSENGTDVRFVGPESINEINSADEVILTEKLDISDLNSVIDEVKTVLTVKKKVYGIVYI